MQKNYPGEQWKLVEFNLEFTNDFKLEVSNFGRLRTFNKTSNGNIINGSMVNGYRIVRLKLFKHREAQVQQRLDYLKQQVIKLQRNLKLLKEDKADKAVIKETADMLENIKANLSKKFKEDVKKRTINYHSLFHRLVADYFLKKPAAGQTIVSHLDHNKLNNRANNLKWMTVQENSAHQQLSPHVIAEKKQRPLNKDESRAAKLTVTKVMLLKKLLRQEKPIKQLVRQFKVTDTQILRIKRGENWANIKAAD